MLQARSSPYVWVTWITKLLAGECSCEWASWFKAHYQNYERVPDDFDQVTWQMEHAELLRKTRDKLDEEGYKVSVESQNAFVLRGQIGTLAGKPDLIALDGDVGLILDAKTGQPKASDRIQVMIYIWAIPKAFPHLKKVKFDGKIVYKSYESIILGRDVDEEFERRVREMMHTICDGNSARRCPSYGECRYCHISLADCPERIENDEGCGFSSDTTLF